MGGAVVAAGRGYRAPAWIGAALAVVGLALVVVNFGVTRSRTPTADEERPLEAVR